MTSQPSIAFFRVDANPEIGAGHLMRCIALAQSFKEAGITSCFLMNERTSALLPSLANFQFEFRVLNSAETEIAEIKSCIESLTATMPCLAVIVDGYQFSAEYRFQLRSMGYLLVVLDDQNNSGELYADLIINPLESAHEMNYASSAAVARYLFGHQYVLLQPAFQKALPSPISERHVLMVTFGASDVKDLTRAFLAELNQIDDCVEHIAVITGAAYPHKHSLDELIDNIHDQVTDHKMRVEHLHAVADMTQAMQQARLAISAAGSTQFELACLCVPSILVVVADNQLAGAKEQEALGWCQVVDARKGLNVKSLLTQATQLWQDQTRLAEMHNAARHLNYKNGGQRIVRAIRQVYAYQQKQEGIAAYGVVLCPLNESDLERVREWRNDPFIQQFMLDQSHISAEQQQSWFKRLRHDVSQAYFVIRFKAEPVGVINIKATDHGPLFQAAKIEIGLYIYAPRYRSNLLAFCPSLAMIDYCFEILCCEKIVASVLPANQAAINYNRQLGYRMCSEDKTDNATTHMELAYTDYLNATQKIKVLIRY